MVRPVRLSEPAIQDRENIWFYTARTYDVAQAIAYDALIDQAIRDLEFDAERPTSRSATKLGPALRSYHISLSKTRSEIRIKSPRHIIYYSLRDPEEVFVLRILHDLMDPKRHLT